MTAAAQRWVVFDLGETLVDETENWGRWADYLAVPRLTFFAALRAVIAARRPHTDVFELFRPGFRLQDERPSRRRRPGPVGGPGPAGEPEPAGVGARASQSRAEPAYARARAGELRDVPAAAARLDAAAAFPMPTHEAIASKTGTKARIARHPGVGANRDHVRSR